MNVELIKYNILRIDSQIFERSLKTKPEFTIRIYSRAVGAALQFLPHRLLRILKAK